MGLSSKQVSSDTNGWNQALLQDSAGTLEFPKPCSIKRQPPPPEPSKCPRCDSENTKFCYYNNYNKSQPRHFCKACKRHWTKGGTLRNVPVGGGRKNKRLKTPKPASKTSSTPATTTNSVTAGSLMNGIKNSDMAVAVQAPQQARDNVNLPVVGAVVEDKSFPEAFSETLLKQSSTSLLESSVKFNKGFNEGIFMGSLTSLGLSPHHHEVQFPYLSLGSFENNNSNNNNNNNPCSVLSAITSVQSTHVYSYSEDHHQEISRVMNSDQYDEQTWSSMGPTEEDATKVTSNAMDMSSNWGWDDFDKFVSVESDDLTMPWDGPDIKP